MGSLAFAGEAQIEEDGAVTGAVAPPRTQLRAGAKALLVLSTPLNLLILRSLADRPMRLADLRKASGLPAQTTLRSYLASLNELGAVAKRSTRQMPYAVENELTPFGRELLGVADLLETWLRKAPTGPISIENGSAKGVVRALIGGWVSTMMAVLAVHPRSLTELDRLIVDHSYPALERRLASLRMAGLAEARPGRGAGTPYGITDWGRAGVVPLAAASHCEQIHLRSSSPPVTQIDIEAAFLLAVPLVELSEGATGSCQLEVDAGHGAAPAPTGVRVTVERGEVVSCASRLEPNAAIYAVGSTFEWFRAVTPGEADRLRFGDTGLARDLVLGLHGALR